MKNLHCNISKNTGLISCLRLVLVFSWIGTLIIANQTELLIEAFIGYLVLLFVAYTALNRKKPTPKRNTTGVQPNEKFLKQESHENYLSIFYP